MGKLFYGSSSSPIEIPDRLLAHVKVVMATKLRRGEAFTLSWASETGRESIWIQQSIPLRFVFSTPEPESLDPELLSRLAKAANVAGNLALNITDVVEEQVAPSVVTAPAMRRPVAA
ncbi:MAG: hypothetical protein NT132_03850 [Microbacterium sp.]|uniref:DUF7882 family protein n=1 Tax=Microbacterium sp. TaxID=51671 RepID=UPI00260C6BFD|nr:hypothetical protein [Microbacterium sp.]MCX6501532.1 hypothetical protein [Microbacterium sp.]